jgi:hypothetical protein
LEENWDWATSLFIAPYTANVGIGTADPKAKLHIAGDMIVDSNATVGTAIVDLIAVKNNILVGTNISTTDATKATIYSKTTQNNPLRIDGQCGCENYYWFNGSSWKRAMTKGSMYPALFIEKGTNNVGIGHISIGNELPPLSAKLHVAQANMAVSPFHVQHKEYVGPGFSSDQDWRWATSLFVAPYTANVGIGTASPSAKLHVNGTGIFTGAVIVGNPTLDSHAATKKYVDSHSGGLPTGGSDGAFLRMTSSGPIWDTLLTWQGSFHTTYDCVKIGGTEFDTGTTGTICRLPSTTVPFGWTQADNWARFDPYEWGGDDCGKNKSGTGTPDFANRKVVLRRRNPNSCSTGSWRACAWYSCSGWCTSYDGSGNPPYKSCITIDDVKDHAEINRVEVGIY